MRRLAAFMVVIFLAGATFAACGFGLADNTGKPIPGEYWPWVCSNGVAPPGDAGCPPVDGGVDADSGPATDGSPADGPVPDR